MVLTPQEPGPACQGSIVVDGGNEERLPQNWHFVPKASANDCISETPTIGFGMFGTYRLREQDQMDSGERIEDGLCLSLAVDESHLESSRPRKRWLTQTKQPRERGSTYESIRWRMPGGKPSMPGMALGATGGFGGRRGLLGSGCRSASSSEAVSSDCDAGPLGEGVGMETWTKVAGDRLRFPVLTLSSVNGVSSMPGKERERHKRRVGTGLCLASEDRECSISRILRACRVRSRCHTSHNAEPVSRWYLSQVRSGVNEGQGRSC